MVVGRRSRSSCLLVATVVQSTVVAHGNRVSCVLCVTAKLELQHLTGWQASYSAWSKHNGRTKTHEVHEETYSCPWDLGVSMSRGLDLGWTHARRG